MSFRTILLILFCIATSCGNNNPKQQETEREPTAQCLKGEFVVTAMEGTFVGQVVVFHPSDWNYSTSDTVAFRQIW